MLLLLHSTFILSVVKMLLKGEVGGCALNIHGNYIVDHGISWKNHGIEVLNFCGNLVRRRSRKGLKMERILLSAFFHQYANCNRRNILQS